METGKVNAVARASAVPMEHEGTAADKALLEQGGNLHKVIVSTPHQVYPRHVHKLATDKKTGEVSRVWKEVASAADQSDAEADGWAVTPPDLPAAPDEGDADEPAAAPSSKKGRKKADA